MDPQTPARHGPWLVADIGGSNARFGMSAGKGAEIQHIRTLAVHDYPGLAEAVKAYLAELATLLGQQFQPPCRAAFAVATPITGDHVEMTNSPWGFSRAAVQAQLQLDSLLVLNDFEALALSLPRLQASQLKAHGTLPRPHGVLAVVGPGTGLGVASVVQTRNGWVAIPAEGGHATLAAADDFEAELLAYVRDRYAHVSGERLLSGIGLPLLYEAVAAVAGTVGAVPMSTEHIVEYGLAGSDAVCRRTLDVFCALLGTVAGNLALILGARGGVYIGGGIVPRLGDYFFASRFRECFEAKGRLRSYMEEIPTALITDTLAALTGAAVALEQEHM
ncbi:glucokinase [Undibacterium sp. TJN25]|uniref:glucokinase n=1 Tax=Undibacterium sp. TJN25 TaxID=3413056 RepID=UPI003BF186E5